MEIKGGFDRNADYGLGAANVNVTIHGYELLNMDENIRTRIIGKIAERFVEENYADFVARIDKDDLFGQVIAEVNKIFADRLIKSLTEDR